jgi:hypothetical protein
MTDPQPNIVASPGGGVGAKVSKLLADATVYTRQRMGPHQNALAQKVLADFTNHVSDEIRNIMGPLWADFANAEETPERLRPLFKSLAEERGQAFAWIAGSITGGAMSVGLSGILNNMLAPVVQKVLSGDPNLQLTPNDAANLVARGLWTSDSGRSEAARSGVDGNRFAALAQLASNHPAPGELLEMLRRGTISEDRARGLMQANGFNRNDVDLMMTLKPTHLTPEQLAAMVNRDIVSTDEGRSGASKYGVSSKDFDKLTLLGGDPLPPQDLGVAYRRGIISRDRFEKGIIQGPLRKEWFDVLEKLQISRMSTVDAADAVNQGYMQLSEAQRIARENGLDPEDFETLILMAGQPPGVEFAQEAWNRGFISEAEFSQMFLESRIKNRYLPLLKKMRTRLIPQETARAAYRKGVYSRDKLLSTLQAHGFSAEDAATLAEMEDVGGDDTTRELTRAQIVDLYEEGVFAAETALELLLGMGYSAEHSQAMLELADLKNVRKYINSAVTRVRSSYLAGKITDAMASAQLDALGIQPGQRDNLMSIWDIDKDTVTKTLTAAQIRQAVKSQLITQEDGMARLVAQGYATDDASLYLQLSS